MIDFLKTLLIKENKYISLNLDGLPGFFIHFMKEMKHYSKGKLNFND